MPEETKGSGPPVTVEKVDDGNRADVLRLEVAELHLPYVRPVAEMLRGDQRDGAPEPYAIRAGVEVVGFFRLDFERGRVSKYAGDGDKCGLRGYLIGRQHQGKGYGSAAIPALRDRYPGIADLVLTVNLRNAAAISTYLKTGFRDTGNVYHGGDSGPQHVFSLPLR